MESYDNRFALGNPRFVERYVEMELHVLLHFRFRDGAEYIAWFQDAKRVGRYENATEIRNGFAGVASSINVRRPNAFTWRHAMCRIGRSDSKQKAVFVDCVKSVETPERVIPSFVWLDRIDSVNRILAHSLYFSSKVGGCIFLRTVGDREIDVCAGGFPVAEATRW